jgi:S-(hydroxymethyl)glutathione dehydrogenase/alcohol dehydrogenase
MSGGTPVQMANGPSGYSEFLVTWEEFVVPVFTKVPPVELSLLACVSACGLGLAMCRYPVEAGSDVVVFGLGPVGLSALQGARIQGATRIIGVDPIKYRRELAMKLGATHVIDSNADRGNDLVNKINAIAADVVPAGRFFAGQIRPNQAGAMYVLEAVGGTRFPLPAGIESPFDMTGVDALQQCYNVVRGGGYLRTCSVGHPANATVSFPAARWANSSKTHVPGNFAGVQALRDIPRFVRLIERGLFDAKSLVGKTYPSDQTREALQACADRRVISSIIVYS